MDGDVAGRRLAAIWTGRPVSAIIQGFGELAQLVRAEES
jgi:hypothetical protein